ncbi:hypothetical protein F5Y01DRAFT_299772 [Xylaria sp. FL0043]|nr:hypothetical protein F5Y01DRAFT_299772 [Xylaria sp. FL0043]
MTSRTRVVIEVAYIVLVALSSAPWITLALPPEESVMSLLALALAPLLLLVLKSPLLLLMFPVLLLLLLISPLVTALLLVLNSPS